MEEGVLSQVQKSKISELFHSDQIITSQSGSGNNWGVGYSVYGPQFKDRLLECIRKQAEQCDALNSFFSISSLGGGTGSGLGSFIGELLMEEYPEVYRFSTVVSPSPNDDVVTSPYNRYSFLLMFSILSLNSLLQTADIILPVENQALYSIYDKIVQSSGLVKKGSSLIDSPTTPKAFDTMNNIVANLLMNMTSSMRFEGQLNVDISDIATNLVPFPSLKFIISSMTPLYSLVNPQAPTRK
jgi:tubulin epsilon